MNVGDQNLKTIRLLGEGTFGRVFLCICTKNRQNRRVCVKCIKIPNSETEMRMLQEEVYIISQLQHPHIVRFIRSFEHAGTVNIVMEYLDNGTIRDVINRTKCRSPIGERQLLSFFLDMLMGLEYLHIRHVTHRDIKPENLLLDRHNRIKYADFGISGIHHALLKDHIKSAGTPLYSAPEVLKNQCFDYKSDIWSLGCVLYELCNSHSPFSMARDSLHLFDLMRLLTHPKINCSKVKKLYGNLFANLCEEMITYDIRQRISLQGIIGIHPTITLPINRRYFNYNY